MTRDDIKKLSPANITRLLSLLCFLLLFLPAISVKAKSAGIFDFEIIWASIIRIIGGWYSERYIVGIVLRPQSYAAFSIIFIVAILVLNTSKILSEKVTAIVTAVLAFLNILLWIIIRIVVHVAVGRIYNASITLFFVINILFLIAIEVISILAVTGTINPDENLIIRIKNLGKKKSPTPAQPVYNQNVQPVEYAPLNSDSVASSMESEFYDGNMIHQIEEDKRQKEEEQRQYEQEKIRLEEERKRQELLREKREADRRRQEEMRRQQEAYKREQEEQLRAQEAYKREQEEQLMQQEEYRKQYQAQLRRQESKGVRQQMSEAPTDVNQTEHGSSLFCSACGYQLPAGSLFCERCGAKL